MTRRFSCLIWVFLWLAPLHLEGQSLKKPIPPKGQACYDLSCIKEAGNVRTLDLQKRYRHSVPIDGKHLRQLEWLNLAHNKLLSVPSWVCDCENLKVLDLSRNQINRLPDCLGDLKHLRYLSINRNPLPFLPTSMLALDSLEVLDLWQTWIDHFDPAFVSWKGGLKVLDLRDIRMNREQQDTIKDLFSGTEIFMASPCNCRPHRRK